jgi:phosphate-selective porin OprO/OprP
LQKQVTSLEAQIKEQQKKEATPASSDLKVSWKGAPELSSADGRNRIKLRGRVVADIAEIDEDKAVTGLDHIDSTELRGVHLGLQGTLDGDFEYAIETDLADNARLTDVHVTYTGLPVSLTFGNLKAGTSLEKATSDLYITFMERNSAIQAFSLGRQIGLELGYASALWTLSGGVYRGTINDIQSREGLTLAGRITTAPHMGDTLLHLGVNFRYRENGGDNALFRYSERPHLHLADKLVDTGAIGEADTLIGTEAALVRGPLSLQGEYMRLAVDTPAVADHDPTYRSYYVSGSWFLTGEHRPYSAGRFGRVAVIRPVTKGGFGAWEIALRYDRLDLSDEDYRGGIQGTYLVGANWYVNDYVRLTANYNHSTIEDGAQDGARIDGFGFRMQLDW